MNQMLLHADPYTQALDWVYNYFKERRNMSYKRCGSILAKSDGLKGHDFVFVWMLERARCLVPKIGTHPESIEEKRSINVTVRDSRSLLNINKSTP